MFFFFVWLANESFVILLYNSPLCVEVKNKGLWIQSEKAMAPLSSTLAWKIPWMEEPGSCSLWGRSESNTTEWLHFHFSLSCIGEGNGNPLQYSCLENPRDGGAWWAAVSGVAQSRTWLKRLSSSSRYWVGEGSGIPLQYSCLESPMDGAAW